jgi:hypothetical protein
VSASPLAAGSGAAFGAGGVYVAVLALFGRAGFAMGVMFASSAAASGVAGTRSVCCWGCVRSAPQ